MTVLVTCPAVGRGHGGGVKEEVQAGNQADRASYARGSLMSWCRVRLRRSSKSCSHSEKVSKKTISKGM